MHMSQPWHMHSGHYAYDSLSLNFFFIPERKFYSIISILFKYLFRYVFLVELCFWLKLWKVGSWAITNQNNITVWRMSFQIRQFTNDKIVACRVASNYPFAKLMEIAENVPTGRVRQATKFFKRQATKF